MAKDLSRDGDTVSEIKLHLGCGKIVLDGYYNIDLTQEAPDVIQGDVIILERYWPNCVSEIISFHLFEHLPRPGGQEPNVETALRRWYEILKPGGKLIIECPDFDAVVNQYVFGMKERINNIFGLNRFDGDKHQWGYSPISITTLLTKHGFVDIVVSDGTDYHAKLEPCMRVECIKGAKS